MAINNELKSESKKVEWGNGYCALISVSAKYAVILGPTSTKISCPENCFSPEQEIWNNPVIVR